MQVFMIDYKKKRNYNERDVNETVEMFNKGHFHKVADVFGNSCEEVYQQTQNGFEPWTQNPDIILTELTRRTREYTRSTMIGDVILKGHGSPGLKKEYFVVSSFGFQKLQGVEDFR